MLLEPHKPRSCILSLSGTTLGWDTVHMLLRFHSCGWQCSVDLHEGEMLYFGHCLTKRLMYWILGLQHEAVLPGGCGSLGSESELEEAGHCDGTLGSVLTRPRPIGLSATWLGMYWKATHSCRHDVLSKCMGPSDHGVKSLELGTQINPSSSKLFPSDIPS